MSDKTGAPVDSRAEQPLGIAGIIRYSAIFAAIVAPANLVFLGFPAGIFAIWLVARLIAKQHQRQITVTESFRLALGSWVSIAIVGFAIHGIPLTPFLAFKLVEFATVWAAYLWLARYVIGRHVVAPKRAATLSAEQMLALQKERYAEATARSLTLGVAWLTVGMFGMLLVIILALIVSVALSLLGLGGDGKTAFLIAVPTGMAVLLGGWAYYIQRKASEVFPSHKMVLWLRRFHQADLMEFPFPAFLEELCRGVAVPITLQDSTVSGANNAAQLRPAFHLLRTLMMVSWFMFFISAIAASDSESWQDPQALIGGAGVVLAIVMFVGSAIAIRRLDVVRLGSGPGRKLAEDLLAAINSKQGVPQTLTVVSTPDEDWQHWVLLFIERAHAVIIDVTRLSENVHWELRTLTDKLLPEQLIIAFGCLEDQAQELPAEVESELAAVIGHPMLERSQRFFYTIPRRRWWRHIALARGKQKGWLQTPKAMSEIYSKRLAEALVNAFAVSDRTLKNEAATIGGA